MPNSNSFALRSFSEKLFITLCSLLPGIYYFTKAYLMSSRFLFHCACAFTLVCPLFVIGSTKLYSKLSPNRLGAAVTAIFKSLPGLLGSMLYISTSSLRCVINTPSSQSELGDLGFFLQCGNPSRPTYYITAFMLAGWAFTYVVPPMLSSGKSLTWNAVMNLKVGKVEGLILALFCLISAQSLALYALTNNAGEEASDYLERFMMVMDYSCASLFMVTTYEYVIKAFFCKIQRQQSRPGSPDANTFTPML